MPVGRADESDLMFSDFCHALVHVQLFGKFAFWNQKAEGRRQKAADRGQQAAGRRST